MLTAWVYTVVSTSKQVDTLPDQERWAKQSAAANGWTITRTISGVSSGKTGARKLLGSGSILRTAGVPLERTRVVGLGHAEALKHR